MRDKPNNSRPLLFRPTLDSRYFATVVRGMEPTRNRCPLGPIPFVKGKTRRTMLSWSLSSCQLLSASPLCRRLVSDKYGAGRSNALADRCDAMCKACNRSRLVIFNQMPPLTVRCLRLSVTRPSGSSPALRIALRMYNYGFVQ